MNSQTGEGSAWASGEFLFPSQNLQNSFTKSSTGRHTRALQKRSPVYCFHRGPQGPGGSKAATGFPFPYSLTICLSEDGPSVAASVGLRSEMYIDCGGGGRDGPADDRRRSSATDGRRRQADAAHGGRRWTAATKRAGDGRRAAAAAAAAVAAGQNVSFVFCLPGTTTAPDLPQKPQPPMETINGIPATCDLQCNAGPDHLL